MGGSSDKAGRKSIYWGRMQNLCDGAGGHASFLAIEKATLRKEISLYKDIAVKKEMLVKIKNMQGGDAATLFPLWLLSQPTVNCQLVQAFLFSLAAL